MNEAIAGLPVSDIAPKHRFDAARLEAYLAPRIADFGEGLEVRQFQGGASNPTFLLVTRAADGFKRYVLRKKPPAWCWRAPTRSTANMPPCALSDRPTFPCRTHGCCAWMIR